MLHELAEKFSEDMAYVILENPKVNNSVTECLLSFFGCIDNGDKNTVVPGADRITVVIDGKKHEFSTKDRSYLAVLKEILYETYYYPKLSK